GHHATGTCDSPSPSSNGWNRWLVVVWLCAPGIAPVVCEGTGSPQPGRGGDVPQGKPGGPDQPRPTRSFETRAQVWINGKPGMNAEDDTLQNVTGLQFRFGTLFAEHRY